jgi:hypothetical protein
MYELCMDHIVKFEPIGKSKECDVGLKAASALISNTLNIIIMGIIVCY